MFGSNPIRSAVKDPTKLAVEEVFYTIQGEGPFSGMPALFIRLAGCNLACHFCDTQFESQAENYQPVGSILASILETYTAKQREFVVLTGGEPLRQDASALVEQLYRTGTKHVQIETAGTLPLGTLETHVRHERMTIVCSPKTPSVHNQVIDLCHHWKYVVRAGEVSELDGLPSRGTQVKTAFKEQTLYRASRANNTIWVSPCDDHVASRNKVNQDLARDICLKHGYRLSLQVHKIIGVA